MAGCVSTSHSFFCDVGPVSIVMFVSYLHISVWTTNYWSTRALFHIFFSTLHRAYHRLSRKEWWATVYRVAKSETRLKQFSIHTCTAQGIILPFQTFLPFLVTVPDLFITESFSFCVNFYFKKILHSSIISVLIINFWGANLNSLPKANASLTLS